jgi:hypothetical protein
VCDVTAAVQQAFDDRYAFAQFRLRHEMAGDGDGSQDMVMFLIGGSNVNEPGIFELAVDVGS